MNCAECQELLVAHLEETLEPATDAGVREHLDACPQCRALADSYGQLFRRLSASTSTPAPAPAEDQVMDRILREQTFMLRRQAMRTRLMRAGFGLGAVAVLLVAGIVGLRGFGGRPAEAAMLLQQVLTASQAYAGWVHAVSESVSQTGVPEEGPQMHHVEYHWNTVDRRRALVVDSVAGRFVRYVDPVHGQLVEFDSASGDLFVTPLPPEDPNDDSLPAQLPRFMTADALLAALAPRGDERRHEIKYSREGTQERFDVTIEPPPDYAEQQVNITIWANASTRLIERLHMYQTRSTGQIEMTLAYHYGAPEINDVYNLGVPRDAGVFDPRRPKTQADDTNADIERLLDQLDRRASAFDCFGDFVAIEATLVLLPDGNTSAPTELRVWGRASRQNVFAGFWAGKASIAPDLWKLTGWPTPDVETLLQIARLARPVKYAVVDDSGKVVTRFYDADQQKYRQGQRTDVREATLFTLPGMLWPGRHMINLQHGGRVKSRLSLLHDPHRPTLIGLCIAETWPASQSQELGGPPNEAGWRTVYINWLDPARENLPVDRIRQTIAADGGVYYEQRCDNYEFTQVESGRWYPTSWHLTGSQRVDGELTPQMWRLVRLTLIPGRRLEPDWFTPAAERFGSGDR